MIVLDVETTGLDPATSAVVEIAAVNISDGGIGRSVSTRVNPWQAIPPEASAIHHIIDADVLDAPHLAKALDLILPPEWALAADNIYIAHNCRFDRAFLPELHSFRWIDTYRCAMHVWPDSPNFQNCTLFYWLGLQRPADIAPHSSLFDATITAHVFIRLLAERSIDDLLRLSTKAAVLKKVGFGKHFGKLWTEVPTDYLDWGNRQADFDPDVKFTIKNELARRAL